MVRSAARPRVSNHEAYANRDEIAASSAVKRLLKNEGRRLLDMRSS